MLTFGFARPVGDSGLQKVTTPVSNFLTLRNLAAPNACLGPTLDKRCEDTGYFPLNRNYLYRIFSFVKPHGDIMKIGTYKGSRPTSPVAPKTTNAAGGEAYLVTDPVEKLIFTVGHLLGEPTYYDEDGVNDAATALLFTCQDVLNSDTPEDLFIVASWARDQVNGLKLRATPLLLLMAAIQDNGSSVRRFGSLVRKYGPSILKRADEPRLLFAMWSYIYGGGKQRTAKIPQALKKVIADRLERATEYELAKWVGNGRPSMADVVRVCARHLIKLPKIQYILNREQWITGDNGRYNPAIETPYLYARWYLANCNGELTETAKKLIRENDFTWDFLSSLFGHDEIQKMWIWNAVAPRLPYQAKLMNIRNMIDNCVDLDPVLNELSDPEAVRKGGQLPYKYLAALRFSTTKVVSRFGVTEYREEDHDMDHFTKKLIREKLSKAMDVSLEALPDLPGRTAILVDVSGSMTDPVSGKSKMSCMDVATTLAAAFYKKSNAVVVPFHSNVVNVTLDQNSTMITLIDQLQRNVGGATYGDRAINHLTQHGIKVDRIILLSDMQIYRSYGYTGSSMQQALQEYRKVCPGVKLYSINLTGTPESPTSPDKNVHLLSGFSENLITLIRDIESGENGSQKNELPTIRELRKRYKK